LPGGDVRLLANACINQRCADVAGRLVKGTQRAGFLNDALFRTDEEEGRGSNDDQGKQATRQSQRA
jgi:hypothetical protein